MAEKKKNKQVIESKPVKKAATAKRSNALLPWLCVAAIAAITFFVFSPSLQDGFTNWDDNYYVTDNPLVVNNIVPVIKIFETPVASNYHPLTMLTLAWNYQIGKLDPFGYHLVNVIFHVLNTILVFFFIFLLTRRNLLMASIVALFFGIHPMHVESVAWVSERKDVLYVFFFMAGLITYLRYRATKKTGWYLFTFLLFILSCLSKGMAVVFPVILLLVDYLIGVKWERRLWLEKIPFFILSIIFGIIAVKVQMTGAISEMKTFSITQRLIFSSYGAIMYIIKLFVPAKLSAFYPYPDIYGTEGIPIIFYLLSVVFLVIVAVIIYFFKNKEKEIVFGLLFYLVSVTLVLQLITVGSAIIADRYSYLSYIGLLFVVAHLSDKAWSRLRSALILLKYSVVVIVIIVATLFSYQSYARAQVWNSGETLWTDVINNYNEAAIAYVNRGNYYINKNDIAKALADYDTALKFNVFSANSYRDAYYNKGLIYYKYGKFDSAFVDLSKVIAVSPTYVNAYVNIGNIYYNYGKYNLALADYKEAITLDTDCADAYNDCGTIYYKTLKDDSALLFFDKAIELNSTNASYYYNRGLEYKATNQYEKALADFNKGIELNPDKVTLYLNAKADVVKELQGK